MHPHLLEAHAIGERLRRLSPECEPPLSWEEFQLRTTAAANRAAAPVGVSLGWRQLALAAGIATAVAGLAVWARLSLFTFGTDAPQVTAQSELPMLAMPDRQAFTQAEASERWLSRLPAEPAVMRVGTRAAVTNLEDRIAWMDDVLSAERLDAVDPSHIVALQRERARLMNSLAQVRYAETLVAAAR